MSEIPKRLLKRNFGTPITKTDAILSNKVVPNLELRKLESADKARLASIYPFAKDWSLLKILEFDRSGLPITVNGKVYYPRNYKDPLISKDTKTKEEHAKAKEDFKKEAKRQENIKLQDLMEDANKLFFRWIPGVGTFMSISNALWAGNTGNPRANEYATNAGLSLIGDAAILATGGVKPSNLVSSYIGSKLGKKIGEKYDIPLVGEVTGAVLGGRASGMAKDIYNIGNTLNNFRKLSKVWNLNVKNPNYLTTLYIEHVTPYGRKFGSQYNTYSKLDVGLHVSYPNSKVTKAIVANNPDTPMTVKEGYFVYSPATKPVDLGPDKGNWEHTFNKELYEKYPWIYKDITLDDSNTLDAVQIASYIPSGTYKNGFESKGETSIALFDPNIFMLSENEIVPLQRNYSRNLSFNKNQNTLSNNSGIIIPKVTREVNNPELNTYSTISITPLGVLLTLSDEAVSLFILPKIEELKKYYNSAFFARRLAKNGLLNKRDLIVNLAITNLDNTIYGVGNKSNLGNTEAVTGRDNNNPINPIVLFNTDKDVSTGYNAIHEGGHVASLNLPDILDHNILFLENNKSLIKPKIIADPKVYLYMLNTNLNLQNKNARITEILGQLQNTLLHMQKNNLTADQVLNDFEYIEKDPNLKQMLLLFGKNYVRKVLLPTGVLSLALINNSNGN